MSHYIINYQQVGTTPNAVETRLSYEGNEIEINDFIVHHNLKNLEGVVTTEEIIDPINEMDGDILVRLSCKGGSIEAGLNIFNRLKDYDRGETTARVEGYAFSTGGWIPQGCDNREIATGGLFMCHNPRVVRPLAKEEDFVSAKNEWDANRQSIISIFTEATGNSAEEIGNMMDATTFLSAEEAVSKGFFDKVYTGKANLAALNYAGMDIPEQFREAVNISAKHFSPFEKRVPVKDLLSRKAKIFHPAKPSKLPGSK